MKYRIENGQITMPVEEFNRINDNCEELEKREAEVKKCEGKIKFLLEKHYNGQVVYGDNRDYEKIGYWTNDEVTKYLVESIDILVEKLKNSKEQEKSLAELKKMTVKEFKEWKKQTSVK